MKYKRFPEKAWRHYTTLISIWKLSSEMQDQHVTPLTRTNERKRRQAAKKHTPSNESYKNWFAFSKIGLTVSLGNSSRFRGATALLNQIMTVNQVERKVLGKKFLGWM